MTYADILSVSVLGLKDDHVLLSGFNCISRLELLSGMSNGPYEFSWLDDTAPMAPE